MRTSPRLSLAIAAARRAVRRRFALLGAFLLVAGLTTGLATTTSAGPAAASSWLNPNPSVAANNIGDQWVFWKGQDGNLWEAFNNKGTAWEGPFRISQMGLLGSAPTVAVYGETGTIPYVTWTGNDGHLWYAYDGSGGWVGPCNLGMGTIPTSNVPSIFAAQNSGTQLTIAWRGGDGDLWEAASPDSASCTGWSGPHNLGGGPLGSNPSGFGPASGEDLQAAWTGTSPGNNLYFDYQQGSLYNLGDGPLGSQPSFSEYPYPGHYEVWWAGQDANLWTAEIDLNGVDGYPDASKAVKWNTGQMASAPSGTWNGADTESGNTWYVVWQGTDGGLWEFSEMFAGEAKVTEIPGMGPL